jgi:hypothetical protein
MREQKTKPPIGIEPEWYWKAVRCGNLSDAIKRYLDSATHAVPIKWVEEYNRLCEEMNGGRGDE